jgi:hypothetical protein
MDLKKVFEVHAYLPVDFNYISLLPEEGEKNDRERGKEL